MKKQQYLFLTFLCRCFARLQRETFSTTLLLLPFFLFLMPHEDRIDSVDLFWLHAEFTCVTCTTKNAVSPRVCTIASRSVNTKGGSAALVLTRKQEAIARPFPSVRKQFSSSKFSNVCCHSCCHIVRSSYALTFRLTEKQRYRPSHSGILYWDDWTGLDWTCKTRTCKRRTCKTWTSKTRTCKTRTQDRLLRTSFFFFRFFPRL